jgi:glycosyltransferase involved in cell wall biosynthesis
VSPGRVVIDLVAPQSPSYRERGIARHGLDFAQAVVECHGDLIDRVLLHPELPPAGGLERLVSSGKASTSLAHLPTGGIFHLTSAFEPEVPVRTLWPRLASAHRMRLVVTLYDLIPDVFPEMYLVDPGLRRRWRACRELVRVADHVLTLSTSGTDDVVRLLGVAPGRVTVIGAGCDARFRPPAARSDALAAVCREVDGLDGPFMVCNGAIDPRKNLDRLLEAYAGLPGTIREQWQLVVVCRAEPLQRNHYLVMAERLGVAGRVVFPGFVPDPTLVRLYQAADLSVFPSLYEGYGLPVVEARACGAPVIAADNSSLRELVRDGGRFDGLDVSDMSRVMARGLTDDRFRAELLADAAGAPPTWADVADRTAAVYRDLLGRDARPTGAASGRLPGWRTRPRVAVVSPFPPHPSDAAELGERLAAALGAAGADVDRFVEGGIPTGADRLAADRPPADRPPAHRPPADRLPVSALRSADRWRGGYDLIVCHVGEAAVHAGAVALLQRGVLDRTTVAVMAQGLDLRLPYLAAAGAGLLPADLPTTLGDMYPGLEADIGRSGQLSAAETERHGLLLTRAVIGAAGRFLVSSERDAVRARLEARPADAGVVEVRPDGMDALAGDLLAPVRRRLADRAVS